MPDQSNNKTGAELKPAQVAAMLAAAQEFPPTSEGSKFGADAVRIAYARSVDEDERSYGSVWGTPAAAPKLLLDKLGERLAFERMGVRLYEILVSKHEVSGGFAGGPKRESLVLLLNEEHCHHSLLIDAIQQFGGDPTVVTPSADLVGVIGRGVLQVVSDPRTTLLACLEAMLVAELADGAGWDALIEITREAGVGDNQRWVAAFREAERTEDEHRRKLERWIARGQGRAAQANDDD